MPDFRELVLQSKVKMGAMLGGCLLGAVEYKMIRLV